jgi:uncharacterized protein (DUF2336 family)
MDLSFLDTSSQVTPLLVRLYDSQKLHNLTKDKQPQARAQLIAAVGDLMDMKLSARENELVADVLVALVRQAELDLRQTLAERMSVIENVPLRVILQIANDTIEVAAPVLRNSPVLGDMDLAYIIKSKDADYWRAIATRQTLSDPVQNMLAETKDFETAVALAENMSIKLTDRSVVILSDLAQGKDTLAMPLLRRDEVSSDIAAKLYKFASQEIKQYILENFDVDSSVVRNVLDEITLEFIDSSSVSEFTPTPAMTKSAERFAEKGILTPNLMLGALKRGHVQSFIAQFAIFTGMASETVIDILLQPTGQGLAVACKAHKISKPDFISIYLLTNKVRAPSKMVDIKEMTRAIQYYDQIKYEMAKEIMDNSRTGRA